MIASVAESSDIDELLNLEECGFPPVQRWSRVSWASEIGREGRLVLVNRDRTSIEAVACFSVLNDTAELLRIIVHPDKRRCGMARRLIMIGMEWAEASGADRILLEVGRANDSARALYAALGLYTISQRRDYYGPGNDALVMECPLEHPDVMMAGEWSA